MSRKLRVRTSPAMSLFGGIVGLIFVGIGVFVAIPQVGLFGVLWTFIALGITIAHLYNAFSSRGIANEIMEVSGDEPLERADPAARLRTLEDLRAKSLITPSEYEQHRNAILRQL